ncbi:MAG: SprT-like domain-containing protein [Planctomycetota bacterium]
MSHSLPEEHELDLALKALLAQYFPDVRVSYRVQWSRRMRRSAGLCYYKRGVIRLSWQYHAAFPQEILNTLKHELIHAAGVLGHGRKFREEAKRLGCDVKARPMPGRPYKWLYACPACGIEVKTRKRVTLSCGKCARRWDPRYALVLRRALPRPPAPAVPALPRDA